ncbi:hypothetical protein [Thauera aromatica]|uniref:hypothetical protein n=1 Tax=Thauera aromatica TaxID=59405 RepID=UPI000D160909|nr:hypothetical protein [Thauera aromatica]
MKSTALKLAAALILLAALGHFFRYGVVPTGQGVGAYHLDRLTGKITFMRGSEKQTVRNTLDELAAAADFDLAKARSRGFSDYEIEQSLRQRLKQWGDDWSEFESVEPPKNSAAFDSPRPPTTPLPLAEFRKRYPAYGDMPDLELASALHRKFYSDIPWDQYAATIGLTGNKTLTAPAEGNGMKLVEIPDVGVVEFPADMTDAQITEAIEREFLDRK